MEIAYMYGYPLVKFIAALIIAAVIYQIITFYKS